ncbi:MAG TPA: OmpA family protein [Polyangia bacterium]|nr:OmpA family protein [Polyangia bacterium]
MKQTILLSVLIASGCVTTKFHEHKLSEAESLRAAQEKAGADREGKLKDHIGALESKLKDTEAKLDKTTAERDALRKQADDLTALTEQLKGRLEKLGQNVDKLTSEKGALAAGLDDAKNRLEELRKQKAAAEARAQVFRNLVEKLHAMINSGQLKVVIREGRMLIALPNDVLFDSGKTNIKPDGQVALGGVAQALATIADRHFLVAGHTDNVPIHSAHFPSNWELSTARAVEVTKLLIADGMNPKLLAAAGYGEFDPVAPNDTPEHKASNRRIEIVLQPNLSDLPPLDDIKTN